MRHLYLFLLALLAFPIDTYSQTSLSRTQVSMNYRYQRVSRDTNVAQTGLLNYLHDPTATLIWETSGEDQHRLEMLIPSFYHGRVPGEELGWGLAFGGAYQYDLMIFAGVGTRFYLGSGIQLGYNVTRRKPSPNDLSRDRRSSSVQGTFRMGPGFIWDLGDRVFFNVELPIEWISIQHNREVDFIGESEPFVNLDHHWEYPWRNYWTVKAGVGIRFE